MRTIIFDEEDSSFNPHGILRIDKLLSQQFPGRDFAYESLGVNGILSGSGTDLFNEDSFFMRMNPGAEGFITLRQVFDGVIWNHDSRQKYNLSADSSDSLELRAQ